MSSDITAPWIDPLSLLDGWARLVCMDDAPWACLTAVSPNAQHTDVSKGASREQFIHGLLTSMQWETDTVEDPIVTIVPHVGPEGLMWAPLHFSNMVKWMEQLDQLDLVPGTDNIATFRAVKRAINDAEPTEAESNAALRHPGIARNAAQFRIHTAEWDKLIAAMLHPNSGQSLPAFTPEGYARILRINSMEGGRFNPMCRLRTIRPWHCEPYGHSELPNQSERRHWRVIQGHSHKPDVTFYGKRWAVHMSAPNALFAGVELEMELANPATRTRMIAALYNSADELGWHERERLHVEQDGSIDGHGIEVVLMPHELHSAHAEDFWRRMWDTSRVAGASNRHGSCGMHIHVSAAASLESPHGLVDTLRGRHRVTGDMFKGTTGLLIDLVTAMLIGGPQLWACQPVRQLPEEEPQRRSRSIANLALAAFDVQGARPDQLSPLATTSRQGGRGRNYGGTVVQEGNRFATNVFGRPVGWDGNYAAPQLHLIRRKSGMEGDRYRHVNWNNQETIEFRMFGPSDYGVGIDDWINVATQMAGAIVHFSRANALSVLAKGCKIADDITMPTTHQARHFFDSLPRWLQPMLLLQNSAEVLARDPYDVASYMEAFSSLGFQRFTGLEGLYAVLPPATQLASRYPHGWSIGADTNNRNDRFRQYAWEAHTCMHGNTSTRTRDRESVVFHAMIVLWRRFRAFLERQSPNYDILIRHLDRHLVLPTDADLDRLVPMGAGLAGGEDHPQGQDIIEAYVTNPGRPVGVQL